MPLDIFSWLAHGLLVMAAPARLLETALSLPEEDRAEFALRLVESLESLDGKPTANVEAAWASELKGRLEALVAGRAETVSFEQAMADARARLRERRG